MNVSRSGYYAWLSRKPSERQKQNETLLCRIRQFFERSAQAHLRQCAYSTRLARQEGFTCGKQRVARLMRAAGLRAVVAPRFRITTDSKHALPVAANLLARDFSVFRENVKWVADIT